ncbi:MAG: ubiquinol-cytochrome c reductase iron-sulfur subunit [Bacteroidia bacterium]
MDRKTFLIDCAKLGTALTLTLELSACHLFDEPEMKLCTVEDLAAQGHLIKDFNGDDVFITYLEEELTVFSMVCTHKRCTVKYNESKEKFICPCHNGTYNKQGKAISGPPPSPLRKFKTEIRNNEIWVLNSYQ